MKTSELHKCSGLVTAAIVGLLLLCQPQGTHAQPKSCDMSTYPRATQATASWENGRNVRLTDDAKKELATKFCTGAIQASKQLGIAPSEIDEISDKVVWHYLDESLSSRGAIPSIADLIKGEVALGSSSGVPEPKAFGTINFTYRQRVEGIRVGSTYMEPYPTVMARVGSIAVSGLISRRVVCEGTVSVSAVGAVDFVC
jgi:hypothetical protein